MLSVVASIHRWEEAEEQLPTSRSRRRTLSSQGLGSDSLADQGMDPYGGNGYDVNGYDLNAYLGDVNGMDAMYDYGQQGLDTMMTGELFYLMWHSPLMLGARSHAPPSLRQ